MSRREKQFPRLQLSNSVHPVEPGFWPSIENEHFLWASYKGQSLKSSQDISEDMTCPFYCPQADLVHTFTLFVLRRKVPIDREISLRAYDAHFHQLSLFYSDHV